MPSIRTKYFICIAVAIFAAGFALRLTTIGGALEYDEIWTLEFYASKSIGDIFADLSLPNNHPLNSLLVKLTASGENSVSIRLGALLAGLLSIPAAGYLAWLIYRRRRSVLWTMAVIALSAPLAAYSQLARGYSLQFFLLTVFGIGAALLWRGQKKIIANLAISLGAIGSILTLPTSILSLFPAALWTALSLVRQKRFRELAAFAVPGIFAACWYGFNFAQFRAGQHWGVEFSSAGGYFGWLGNTLSLLGVYPLALVFVVIAAWRVNRISLYLLLTGLLPLLAAPVTRGGPTRAYFAAIAIWALLAGGALAAPELAKKRIFNVLFALFLLWGCVQGVKEWRGTDYHALFEAARGEPQQRFVVYPATESNPMAWNNRPDIYKDFIARLLCRDGERELLMLRGSGALNGVDGNGAEKLIKLSAPGKPYRLEGAPGELYRLQELRTAPAAGDTVVAVIRPIPEAAMAAVAEYLKVYDWLKLNFFLIVEFKPQQTPLHYSLLATRVDNPARLDWEKLLRETRGAVSFYLVRP